MLVWSHIGRIILPSETALFLQSFDFDLFLSTWDNPVSTERSLCRYCIQSFNSHKKEHDGVILYLRCDSFMADDDFSVLTGHQIHGENDPLLSEDSR